MSSADGENHIWPACPPLPVGTVLPAAGGGAGFKLLALEAQTPGLNVYRALDLSLTVRCPACGNRSGASAACPSCGRDLTGEMPGPAVVFIHESAERARLGVSPALALREVRHPHLLRPLAAQQSGHGPNARFYVLTPERPAPSLSGRRLPSPPLAVLRWGQQLAAALTALHAAGLVHGQIDSQHVATSEDRAWLTCEPGGMLPAERSVAHDLRGLARVLAGALTASEDLNTVLSAPAPLRDALLPLLAGETSAISSAADFAVRLGAAEATLRAAAQQRMSAAWRTHVGRVRTGNEDSLLVWQADAVWADVRTTAGLYAVADGAGGHAAGELASQAAIAALAAHLTAGLLPGLARGESPDQAGLRAILSEAVQAANTAVRDLRQATGADMITTLTVALLVGSTGLIAHVGDSRAYLRRSEGMQQLTQDHTAAARLVATGALSPEEAARHPARHRLARSLGQADRVEVDLIPLDLASGDTLLLCSDGLYGELADARIQAILNEATDLEQAATTLVDAALTAGGRDNITVLLVRTVSI